MDKAIEFEAIITEKQIKKPWGQTVSYIQNIDVFLLEICSAMK
jgi:lactoylglutathione lyase